MQMFEKIRFELEETYGINFDVLQVKYRYEYLKKRYKNNLRNKNLDKDDLTHIKYKEEFEKISLLEKSLFNKLSEQGVNNKKRVQVTELAEKQNMKYDWTESETLFLLKKYINYIQLVGPGSKFKNKKTMYTKICQELNETYGSNFDALQAKYRYKYLKKKSKNNKSNSNFSFKKEFETIESLNESSLSELKQNINEKVKNNNNINEMSYDMIDSIFIEEKFVYDGSEHAEICDYENQLINSNENYECLNLPDEINDNIVESQHIVKLEISDNQELIVKRTLNENDNGKWSEAATKILLARYIDYLKGVGPGNKFKSKVSMFERICEEIKEAFGTKFEPLQAKYRFEYLKKRYKKAMKNSKLLNTIEYKNEFEIIESLDKNFLSKNSNKILLKQKKMINNKIICNLELKNSLKHQEDDYHWTESLTRFLLESYINYLNQVGPNEKFNNTMAMFEKICNEMEEIFKVKFEPIQAKYQCEYLKKQYKKSLLDKKIIHNKPAEIVNMLEQIILLDNSKLQNSKNFNKLAIK